MEGEERERRGRGERERRGRIIMSFRIVDTKLIQT